MSGQVAAIFDSSAVRAYGDHLRLGQLIAAAAADDEMIIVPVLCLADAYQTCGTGDRLYLLDALASQPAVGITPVNADDGPMLGGWASVVDSLPLAQAMLESATHHVPIVTAHREAVTRLLPKEWPIIDL